MLIVWKIRRELARLGTQSKGALLRALGVLRRVNCDLSRSRNVHTTRGCQSISERLAIFLIYQPDGLLESTLLTLSFLQSKGISTVVVSNSKLRDSELERLAPLSWLIVERPNIGYDFGGYREGVLSVFEHGVRPTELYILNDSMWFPLRPDCDVIEQCRINSSDIFGLYSEGRSRRFKDDRYIQSYFFRFSGRLVGSAEFESFWRNMGLIDHKATVVRIYERNVAHYFLRRGYTADSAIHSQDVIEYLLECKNEERLRKFLLHQCRISYKEAKLISPLLHDGSVLLSASPRVVELIEKRRIFITVTSLHPSILRDLKFPFVKKGRTPSGIAQRDELRALGIHKEFLPAVQSEIERWDMRQS